MDTKKFTSINPDEIVSIDISGSFYYRLQAILLYFYKDIPEERMASLLKDIKNQDFKDDLLAYNLETLLILLQSLEKTFIDEGKVVEKEMPTEKEDQQSDKLI